MIGRLLVESALDRQHLITFGGRKLYAHGVELLNPNPVLPGYRAAQAQAGLQYIGTEELAAAQLFGVACIEQNQRVQVAIARVKYVHAQ